MTFIGFLPERKINVIAYTKKDIEEEKKEQKKLIEQFRKSN